MKFTQGKMTEQEQWAAAARLLEVHGDYVGSVLMGQIRKFMDAGDQASAKEWIDISNKVHALHSSESDG